MTTTDEILKRLGIEPVATLRFNIYGFLQDPNLATPELYESESIKDMKVSISPPIKNQDAFEFLKKHTSGDVPCYTHSDLERIVAEANKRADAIAAEREAYAHELAKCRDVFTYGDDMVPAIGDPLEVADFVRGRVAECQAEKDYLRNGICERLCGDFCNKYEIATAQISECQAREKVLRDVLKSYDGYESALYGAHYEKAEPASSEWHKKRRQALSTLSDTSALDAAIKQAKIGVLEEMIPAFEAASVGVAGAGIYPDMLRRMANELKGE